MALTLYHFVIAGLIVGCFPMNSPQTTQPERPLVRLKARYDPGEVVWAETWGDNRIDGSALLRTRGGEVRTCAASEVFLVPVSAYAEERMDYLYGDVQAGYRPALVRAPIFEPELKSYRRPIRNTTCDAQGEFAFEGVPDGEWYVTTSVVWETPSEIWLLSVQGGSLMQRVRVAGGVTRKLVMTE